MKKLLFLLSILSSDVMSMTRVMQATTRVAPKYPQIKSPRTFGTTHFILGDRRSVVKVPEQQKPQKIEMQPLILNGSSAHLLDQDRSIQSFFTTKHDISSVVLSLLAQAKKSIDVAAFSLTDSRIANQLIEAHKKGIHVNVIMDAGNMQQYYSKAQNLIDNGIPVWRYNPVLRPNYKSKKKYEQLMHLKWIIIDNDILIQGSANLTRAAQDGQNIENVTVVRCPQSVGEHCQELEDLKGYCDKCEPKNFW
jgi:phosphatidylserine/phosphatidylglycerophosphate/cardiolipin synthase-like enzyme